MPVPVGFRAMDRLYPTNAPGKEIGPGELDKALKIISAGGDVNYQGATNVEFNDVGEVFGTYKELEVGGGKFNTIKVH